MFANLFRRLTSTRRSAHQPARSAFFRPQIETLEERRNCSYMLFSLNTIYAEAVEGDHLTFSAHREGPADACSVKYQMIAYSDSNPGDAQKNDLVKSEGWVSFKKGEYDATFVIQTKQDAKFEGNEGFALKLVGAKVPGVCKFLFNETKNDVVCKIIDDDPMPEAVLWPPLFEEAAEGNKTLSFVVKLWGESDLPVKVNYSVESLSPTLMYGDRKDYVVAMPTGPTGTLVFGPKDRSLKIQVKIFNDMIAESSEQFKVTIVPVLNAGGKPDECIFTITDNDKALVHLLNDMGSAAGETHILEGDQGELKTIALRVRLATDVERNVNIGYSVAGNTSPGRAAAGEDFRYTGTNVVFTKGDKKGKELTIVITIIGDNRKEGLEKFLVGLTSVETKTSNSMVWINIVDETTDNE